MNCFTLLLTCPYILNSINNNVIKNFLKNDSPRLYLDVELCRCSRKSCRTHSRARTTVTVIGIYTKKNLQQIRAVTVRATPSIPDSTVRTWTSRQPVKSQPWSGVSVYFGVCLYARARVCVCATRSAAFVYYNIII